MVRLRLYFDRAAAHDTVDELGALGVVQFRDLNAGKTSFTRAFSGDVKACEEMQRRLRYLVAQVGATRGMTAPDLLADGSGDGGGGAIRMDELNAHLSSLERQLLDMNAHDDALGTQYNALVEARYVLEKGATFFHDAPRLASSAYGTVGVGGGGGGSEGSPFGGGGGGGEGDAAEQSRLEAGGGGGGGGFAATGTTSMLSFFSGVIARDRLAPFERVLFRATRGNCLTRFADVPEALIDPATGEAVEKAVYMIFFSGQEVRAKVSKIITAFGANGYDFPEEADQQVAMYEDTRNRLRDLEAVLDTTIATRREMLTDVADQLPTWADAVRREKAVYHALNSLNYDTSSKLFIADVWCPADSVDDVRGALARGRRRSSAQVPSVVEERPFGSVTPPTYFRLNKFTAVFHGLVESYAVAAYHEVNPAPFAVVLFPFLFAVMFGDVAHGSLMALFALGIILREKKMVRNKLNEFMQTCYDGRYMLLLMGLFSIYTGFIYNEAFAVPLDLFGSRWQYTHASAMACGIDNCDVPAAVRPPLAPYPLGFDPVWKASESGLIYFNSYKMKLSIVLGVSQMILGICLSYINGRFSRNKVDVLYVFVPQLLFMSSLFGYLVLLIIIKWATNWESPACLADPNCLPPDLKSVLINMFMAPGIVPAAGQLYKGQAFVQVVLLGIAVIAVPWMLFPKPFLLKAEAERKQRAQYRPLNDEESASAPLIGSSSGSAPADSEGDAGNGKAGGGNSLADDRDEDGGHGEHAFDFSEVFVQQMIHTIEFVLGAVSNTASYLRLWALSLAHAELSDVFLEKLLFLPMESGSIVLCIIGFFLWVALTLGVLMFMESLSAFLHALRLMWVEVSAWRFLGWLRWAAGCGRSLVLCVCTTWSLTVSSAFDPALRLPRLCCLAGFAIARPPRSFKTSSTLLDMANRSSLSPSPSRCSRRRRPRLLKRPLPHPRLVLGDSNAPALELTQCGTAGGGEG